MGIDWSRGDYATLARWLEPAARVVVDTLEPEPRATVLDVACGDGNCALLAAARGARVTGTDAEPALLASAAERADAAGLAVEWVEADAAAMPFASDSFDSVTSVFGVMFAPAEAAASELARVVRPGGRVVLANWLPAGPIAAVGRKVAEALTRHRPDALGPPEPRWGDADQVVELLGAHGLQATVTPRQQEFTAASAEDWVTTNEAAAALWVEAIEAVPATEWAALRGELVAELDNASTVTEGFTVDSPYLLVEATRTAG